MHVEKIGLRQGSCNFCSVDEDQERHISEYDNLYEISRKTIGGLTAAICSKCIASLNAKIARGDV